MNARTKQRKKMADKKNVSREIPISFDGEESFEASIDDESDDPHQIELVEAEAVRQDGDAGEQTKEPGDPGPSARGSVVRLQAQIDALNTERASLFDQLLRRQAEFENYRKRIERERNEIYQRGRDDVLLQLLPVVDNFERALSSLEKSEGDAEALRDGVELIHKQFVDALSKFGLKAVEAVGQAFDPHVHEAVTTEATDKHKENTVIEEFQRGYKIGDRLLRPAKVKVASSPDK
jgi:molecular chaperone GrpE